MRTPGHKALKRLLGKSRRRASHWCESAGAEQGCWGQEVVDITQSLIGSPGVGDDSVAHNTHPAICNTSVKYNYMEVNVINVIVNYHPWPLSPHHHEAGCLLVENAGAFCFTEQKSPSDPLTIKFLIRVTSHALGWEMLQGSTMSWQKTERSSACPDYHSTES